MDRAKVPNVAGPKTRRKLQKGAGSRQPQSSLRRGSIESVQNKHHTVGNALITATTAVTAATRPTIPLPPDLSDSKWLEYIGKSGFLCSATEPPLQSRHALPLPIALVKEGSDKIPPKLSHLAASATRRHQRRQQEQEQEQQRECEQGRASMDDREWIESEASVPSSGSSSPESKSSSIRRRAKTPVFAIGQLEEVEMEKERKKEKERPSVVMMQQLARNDSVEFIAEQYRSLLESRASYFADSQSEPPPSPQQGERQMRRQRRSSDLRIQSVIQQEEAVAGSGLPLLPSPHSDDGTLVSFEEETIYFKPMSFSPEPTSPLAVDRSRDETSNSSIGGGLLFPGAGPASPQLPATWPAADNISLQICLDLLTRELGSCMSERLHRQSVDTSALQIWVMIEAYESLKGTVLDMMASQPEEARRLHDMFDLWVRALSTIHDSMTAESKETLD